MKPVNTSLPHNRGQQCYLLAIQLFNTQNVKVKIIHESKLKLHSKTMSITGLNLLCYRHE